MRIKKLKRPIGWWYHKALCETGWLLRNTTPFGWGMYYEHLEAMIKKYRLNIYGEEC